MVDIAGNVEEFLKVADVAPQEMGDRTILSKLLSYSSWEGLASKESRPWLSDTDISEWHGVTVNDEGRVVKLELGGCNLRGEGSSPPPYLTLT